MYIQSVEINNIRTVRSFKMIFDKPAGWHVLLGDNGAGKSSVARAIAAALIGPVDILPVRPTWNDWLRKDADEGSIALTLAQHAQWDEVTQKGNTDRKSPVVCRLTLKRNGNVNLQDNRGGISGKELPPERYVWGVGKGWFSASYGPFRRFTGGNKDWEKVFVQYPKPAPHLSIFGEDIALTEVLDWLQDQDYKRKDKKTDSRSIENFIAFINKSGLMPHGETVREVNYDGVWVSDANGYDLPVNQLSDGLRSMLSLVFDLLRRLIANYGEAAVFANIDLDLPLVDLPGVVLIDEVDAHLHPSWQSKIGQWFTRFFPNIQFIATTHSALICRAAENGSIWRLAAPGSSELSGRIVGQEYQRLVFGNVLDALGTQVFGREVSRAPNAQEKLRRLAELNVKSRIGQVSADEETEILELKSIFPSRPNGQT